MKTGPRVPRPRPRQMLVVLATMLAGLVLSVGGSSHAWATASSQLGTLYVANGTTGTVSVIDPTSSSVVATVPNQAPYGGYFGVAINPPGTRAYVSGQNGVAVVDTASNKVIAGVPITDGIYGIAASPTLNRVYAANGANGGLYVIDTASNAVVANVPIGPSTPGTGSYSFDVAVNPSGSRVYVANGSASLVATVDTSTNQVVNTITLSGTPGYYHLGIDPSGSRLYVVQGNNGTISVIDTSTNQVIDTVPMTGSSSASIAVAPNGSRAYVTNRANQAVLVLDTASGTIAASIPVSDPVAVAISPDGSRAYVTNQTPGTVTQIDTATNSVIGTPIPTGGINPVGLAVKGNAVPPPSPSPTTAPSPTATVVPSPTATPTSQACSVGSIEVDNSLSGPVSDRVVSGSVSGTSPCQAIITIHNTKNYWVNYKITNYENVPLTPAGGENNLNDQYKVIGPNGEVHYQASFTAPNQLVTVLLDPTIVTGTGARTMNFVQGVLDLVAVFGLSPGPADKIVLEQYPEAVNTLGAMPHASRAADALFSRSPDIPTFTREIIAAAKGGEFELLGTTLGKLGFEDAQAALKELVRKPGRIVTLAQIIVKNFGNVYSLIFQYSSGSVGFKSS